jgi:hypothetical protein
VQKGNAQQRKTALQKERRRFKRHRTDLPARFRIVLPSRPGDATAFYAARISDLSEGGLRMLTDTVRVDELHIFQPAPTTFEQSVLDIEIAGAEAPLTVCARVVWYDRAAEGSPFSFQAGVQFVDLTPEQKEAVLGLLRGLKHGS